MVVQEIREEKLKWKDIDTSDDWKLKNLSEIKSRMKRLAIR